MSPMLRSLIPVPAAWLVKAICATLRVHVLRGDIEQTVWARRGNVIYAFWHGHLLYLMYRYRGSGVHILVSQSRDGEALSRILQRFGLPTIRGSSSRGGRRSLLELVRQVRAGASVARNAFAWRRWSSGTTSSSAIGHYYLGSTDREPDYSSGGRGALEDRISELGSLSPAPARQSYRGGLWRASGGAVRCRLGVVGAQTAGAGGQTPQADGGSNAGNALLYGLFVWERVGVRDDVFAL